MITGNTKRDAAVLRYGDSEETEMGNTMAVTDANFEAEIEKAAGVAVVDFWAEWCGPCRAVGPIIDQLAAEYAGRALMARFDLRRVGTMLEVAGGKRDLTEFVRLLSGGRRSEAGPAVPSKGLTLVGVGYDCLDLWRSER